MCIHNFILVKINALPVPHSHTHSLSLSIPLFLLLSLPHSFSMPSISAYIQPLLSPFRIPSLSLSISLSLCISLYLHFSLSLNPLSLPSLHLSPHPHLSLSLSLSLSLCISGSFPTIQYVTLNTPLEGLISLAIYVLLNAYGSAYVCQICSQSVELFGIFQIFLNL